MLKTKLIDKNNSTNNKELLKEVYCLLKMDFDDQDDVAVTLDSYIMQTPGDVYIEALTNLEVTIIDYGRFHKVTNKHPEVMLDKMFKVYYAVWLEQMLREYQTLVSFKPWMPPSDI